MSYIGNTPGVSSQRIVDTFIATAGQTTFTTSSGYTPGYVDVYYNGVKLVAGDDFTAATGSTIVLASGAALGDSVEIVAYLPRGLSDGYLKSEADARYVALTGAQTIAGVKTFSSQLVGIAGTAGAPAITTTGDLDTGIFFPAANTLAFSTNGTEDARFDASGNLRLGTTSDLSAADKLTVVGGNIAVQRTSGITSFIGDNTQNGYVGTITNHAFAFFTNSSERMRLDTSGRVVVNGTSPNSTTVLTLQETASLSSAIAFRNRNSNQTWALAVDTLAVDDKSLGFLDVTNNVMRLTLTASGRLGVGQTNPSEALHVSGSIRADNGSGTVTSLIATGGGSNLQVVHTSGDSNLSLLNSANAYGGFKLAGNTGSGMTLTGAEGILSAGNVPAYQTLGYFRFNLTKAQGTQIFCISAYPTVDEDSARFYATTGSGASASATGMMVGRNSSTNRSINAAGTINASGADYAEYMTKASDFTIAKGDVVGVDQDGKLTNVFADAVSFVVKSTDPSYVGGDTWFTEKQPVDEEMKDVVDGPIYDAWVERREAARALVDRIAFAGQVPVNVAGAAPGQYIVPVDDNGAIKGQAVSSPNFEQYQLAVGKVIAIEQDGRARIIVKVA